MILPPTSQTKAAATAATQAVIDRHVREGKETGIQVCAYLQGEVLVDTWAGVTAAGGSQLVDGETLFNVFSVSKAVCDVALWIQIDRGLVELDAPVAKYWPAFSQNGKSSCTVRHVLYHRSGVPQMPVGTSPENICDWGWVTAGLAGLTPLFEPGSRSAYACMSQGFILAEVIRRTDPDHRGYREFVEQEIARPLAAESLFLGIPASEHARVAVMDEPITSNYWSEDSLFRQSIPQSVDLGPKVWGQPEMRQATVPSTGGIFNARSEARFWAMLAGGGQFNGRRILKQEAVQSFVSPIPPMNDDPDPVILMPRIPLGAGGIWLSTSFQPALPGRGARVLTKPGYGHSIGWADIDNGLAVAICHNKLFNPHTAADCRMTPIGDAIREVIGIRY